MQIQLLFEAGLKENKVKEKKIGRKIFSFVVWL